MQQGHRVEPGDPVELQTVHRDRRHRGHVQGVRGDRGGGECGFADIARL